MHISRATPPAVLLGCLLLTACSAPKAPDEERRPEPQAQPKSALVQTANDYRDRARSVEQTQLDASDQQRAEIDAQSQ